MAALAITLAVLVASALLSGSSLDDYWTLALSDMARGLPHLARHGWMQDIRPPVFDAWATLLSAMGLTSIALARLVSNLPPLLLLLFATRIFSRRLPGQRGFYTIFLLLTLSAPATIDAFDVYRGDFWQLAAFSIQIMLARHIMFADQDYRRRNDGPIGLIASLAMVAAITLDYGGALFGGITAMATLLIAIARGYRRWARSLLILVVLSIAVVVTAISWQGRAWLTAFDLYQNWIEMGDGSASGIIALLLFGTLLHNPVALAGAWIGRREWTKADSAFAVVIGGALVAALVAITQLDAQRRLITASNTADIAVIVATLMATAGAKIADRRPWMNALTVVAACSSIVALMTVGIGGGWQTGAKKIARIVDSCPTTQVYAASGWRLDGGSASRTAQREEPVFVLGYQRRGRTHGFTPIIIGQGRTMTAQPSGCPTLLWIEQVPPHRQPSARQVLRAAGLKGLDTARLTLIRTKSGLIVRADPQ